ncbi:unnamed protein product, partial [Brachionus calyciflorus]
SPDLNCIENLWSWLDRELAKVGPRSLGELNEIVPEILERVPKKVIENLVDSIPRRINACMKKKGLKLKFIFQNLIKTLKTISNVTKRKYLSLSKYFSTTITDYKGL